MRGLIEQRATAYFAHSPAPDVLSQEEYLHSAREIGAWEGVRPTERMYANNSVHFLPYVPEQHRYGQGATLQLVEEHFSTSSELALDLLRGRAAPTSVNWPPCVICCWLGSSVLMTFASWQDGSSPKRPHGASSVQRMRWRRRTPGFSAGVSDC